MSSRSFRQRRRTGKARGTGKELNCTDVPRARSFQNIDRGMASRRLRSGLAVQTPAVHPRMASCAPRGSRQPRPNEVPSGEHLLVDRNKGHVAVMGVPAQDLQALETAETWRRMSESTSSRVSRGLVMRRCGLRECGLALSRGAPARRLRTPRSSRPSSDPGHRGCRGRPRKAPTRGWARKCSSR